MSDPTIISYRPQTDQTSHFLNVDDLLESDNYEKIKIVYDDIFRSVTAYDPDHVNNLIKIEEKMFGRIIKLETEKKEALKKNNKGWKSICLSILTLGIRAIVLHIKKNDMTDKIKEMNQAHTTFSRALTQMKQRGLEKETLDKPEAIKELEKQRFESIDDELFRLKSIPRIAKSLEEVNSKIKLSIPHQVAYGHSLELREQLKDTHYVINHGQNLDLMIVNIVARKLKQEFEPKHYESFEPLRHDTALRHIQDDIHTVARYQNLLKGAMIDHSLRRELLSGDCVLESTSAYESAIYFFAGNPNIAKSSDYNLVKHLLLPIIQDYIPNQVVAQKLCRDLVKLLFRCPQGGNLYSICVPKEKFDESCYFSLPFGRPLENQNELKEKIENMQSGEDPCGHPQVRILTHKVRAEDEFHVIVNSTFTTERLKEIDDEVALCIQAALTGYRIQKETKGFDFLNKE